MIIYYYPCYGESSGINDATFGNVTALEKHNIPVAEIIEGRKGSSKLLLPNKPDCQLWDVQMFPLPTYQHSPTPPSPSYCCFHPEPSPNTFTLRSDFLIPVKSFCIPTPIKGLLPLRLLIKQNL